MHYVLVIDADADADAPENSEGSVGLARTAHLPIDKTYRSLGNFSILRSGLGRRIRLP